MKYIKTFEDNEFDENNFGKLRKDIKGITIELKDEHFVIVPFEVEDDIGFDNYDYYVKIYKKDIYNALFKIIDVKEYIYTVIDYVGMYYSYDELTIKVDDDKLTELAYVYFESNLNKKVSLIELCFKDIEKKK
jgi:hypothetical protein